MRDEMKQTADKKAKKKTSKSLIRITIIVACLAILMTGSVLAMYISSNQRQAEMISAHFHISSDYLEEEAKDARYAVEYSAHGFDIHLYNYEKENIAQISEVDITYEVEVTGGTVSVNTEEGAAINPVGSNTYQLAGNGSMKTQVLNITPENGASEVTVTVNATAPYAKTLTAKFAVQTNSVPAYEIQDGDDGTALVTVRTNGYSGNVTVNWDRNHFSPDNTNVLMASWTDGSEAISTGQFEAKTNSTYKLLFFKKGQTRAETKIGNGYIIEMTASTTKEAE